MKLAKSQAQTEFLRPDIIARLQEIPILIKSNKIAVLAIWIDSDETENAFISDKIRQANVILAISFIRFTVQHQNLSIFVFAILYLGWHSSNALLLFSTVSLWFFLLELIIAWF